MAREGLIRGWVQLIMKGQDMNTLTRSKLLESFYFVYGLIMFSFGAYFHDWYVVGFMGSGLLVSGLIQQWRARPPAMPTVTPHPTQKLSRRDQLKANGGSHTASEWRLLCELHEWRCADCGRRRPLTKDHVIPVTQGGTDDISNLQPLCRSCNSSKHGRAMEYKRRP